MRIENSFEWREGMPRRMTMQEFADAYGVYVAKDADGSVRCFDRYPDYDEAADRWAVFGEETEFCRNLKARRGCSLSTVSRIDGMVSDAAAYEGCALATPESDNPMIDALSPSLAEMAQTWPKMRLDIMSCDGIRWLHLLKMFYYRAYKGCHDGWIASARKGLDKIPKLKSSNRYPDADTLYALLWKDQEDIIDDFQRNCVGELRSEYPDLPKIGKIDYQGVRAFFSKFIKWECGRIERNGGIHQDETKREIYALLGIKP